ncbi:MAG: hypothetical protein KKE44_10385 [Proteobacteria bacterium]|nr:hypothetical protein [Pseudomonadota bacterium]MBU1583131.1 hypothetical protein [Pseudomonadota bacterium]MBU2453383.1 hypothetical protein [Pseudomonadota bacterium]MBU2627148.1 hypothetical protein [Pseudomonadota bacterium]
MDTLEKLDGTRQLRVLAASIVDSYEIRVDTVCSLMSQANNFLHSFQLELDEMINRLRINLTNSQSLRRKDFDSMIHDILDRHRKIENEAILSLSNFQEEEQEMIRSLRDLIAFRSQNPNKDIEALLEDMLIQQKNREHDIVRILKQIQVEQEELKTGLKKLLEKGEDIRIKDYKAMLNAIRTQHSEYNRELFDLLDDFDLVRNRVNDQWQKIVSTNSI